MLDGDDVKTPPVFPTAPQLYVPRQRSPHQPVSPSGSGTPPPLPFELEAPPAPHVGPGAPYPLPFGSEAPLPRLPFSPAPPPRRRGPFVAGVLALTAALGIAAGAVLVANHEPLDTAAEAAAPTAKPRPLTPLESANQALDRQADALLRGDEKAWLAGVDPARTKLRTRYRSMFRSLRSLGVTHFDYRTSVHADDKKPTTVSVDAQIDYCLADMVCPDGESPSVTQTLTIKPVAGRYVITSLGTRKNDEKQQPAPWEDGNLVFRKGKRVTLIALPGQRRHFGEVLPLAEKAATVNDRFAALVGNPQRRYRIYLAGPKQWKTWYGGITDKWVIGYAMPLNNALHLLRLKAPYRDGTTHLQFAPIELMERLAAQIPKPRVNLVLYACMLAPHAKFRGRGVVYGRPEQSAEQAQAAPQTRAERESWAQLMRATFGLDVLACPRCGGRLRLIANVLDARVAAKKAARVRQQVSERDGVAIRGKLRHVLANVVIDAKPAFGRLNKRHVPSFTGHAFCALKPQGPSGGRARRSPALAQRRFKE